MKSLPLLWVPVHMRPCVCPPEWNLHFPQSCEALAIKPCLLSKPNPLVGGFSPQCQTPRLGTLTWGSELSLLWETFCDINILQFVDCPLRGYEIWLYDECILPTICCFFFISLDVEYHFWGVPVFFIDGRSAVSCVFCVLVKGGKTKVLLLHHLFHPPNNYCSWCSSARSGKCGHSTFASCLTLLRDSLLLFFGSLKDICMPNSEIQFAYSLEN